MSLLIKSAALSAALLGSLVTSAPAPAPEPELDSRAASRFTYYNMPTPLAGPCDLTTGPDGAIWGEEILADNIVRVDPVTGKVEEYPIPYTTGPLLGLPDIAGRGAFGCAIQPGEDGMLYAASGIRNQFVRINPTTKKIDVFTPTPPNAAGDLFPLNDLWRGPEGMFFSQTTGNVITQFKYATEEFINYQVPTPLALPVGVLQGSDGGIWFCEFLANKIGRLNATDGTFKEYSVPLPSLLGPAVMRAETEGKYLWFTAFTGNAIGRIDMYTGEFKAFLNPSPLSFPTEDTVDAQGNIWFSTATQNTLNKLIPSTGKVETVKQPGTLVTVPISVPPAVDIAMHYGPGNAMWFTEVANNRIGRYQL